MEHEEIFDEHLKEFAWRVGIICALEEGGKIAQQETYKEIKKLWKSLKQNKKDLFKKEAEQENRS